MADTVNASIVEHFQTLEDPRIDNTTWKVIAPTEANGEDP